ncbi:uncharacterized protein [Littorina saxatilis]|uniref:Uncharacterized protein n=1 Tax=Littorina saxatilis TaxID=31220 RepID=A0AAN9B7K6_9CAEN
MENFLTDCPQCNKICLGPTILPCGHLACRKCLRLHHKDHNASCLVCERPLPKPNKGQTTVTLAKTLGTDPVVQELVNERLKELGKQPCLVCPNRDATIVCVDCKEMYCAGCSAAHRKMGVSQDHVMQELPQTLFNTPSAAACSAITTVRNIHLDASSCTASSASIRNTGNEPRDHESRAYKKKWKSWVEPQIKVLTNAANERRKVLRKLKEILDLGGTLMSGVEKDEQTLNLYAAILNEYESTGQSSGKTFAVRLATTDVSVDVNTESMQRRLSDVIEILQSPEASAVESLIKRLQQLLQEHGLGKAAFNPLTATPRRTHVSPLAIPGDDHEPCIPAITCTRRGHLVMVDNWNSKVKVMTSTGLGKHIVTSVKLKEEPISIGLLPDDLVAVTTRADVIYLCDISDDGDVLVTSRIQTRRRYCGVDSMSKDCDVLVVSCSEDNDGLAGVDLIDRAGRVLKRLVDGASVEKLKYPKQLCVAGDGVFLSDSSAHAVFKMDLNDGNLLETITHKELKTPKQVAVDKSGNMYIACKDSECVLVRSRGGNWRRLLVAAEHSQAGCVSPYGVCVTKTGVAVAWHKLGNTPKGTSVLTRFDLV